MKNFIWRVIYAVAGFVIFWLIFPLFLNVLDLKLDGSLLALMKVCTACIAVLYVLYPSTPPTPF